MQSRVAGDACRRRRAGAGGDRDALASASSLGSGIARDRRLARGRARAPVRRRGAAARSTCTTSPIPATSARSCARRRRSAPDTVVLSPQTADPFGPKAVRASMGAIFAPARGARDLARGACRARPAAGDRARPRGRAGRCGSSPMPAPPLFVLGAERAGPPAEIVAACDEVAHDPGAPDGPSRSTSR